MKPGKLDMLTKEIIALAVSATNGCTYCINSHSAAVDIGDGEYLRTLRYLPHISLQRRDVQIARALVLGVRSEAPLENSLAKG